MNTAREIRLHAKSNCSDQRYTDGEWPRGARGGGGGGREEEEGETLKGMRENRRHGLSGERGRHEEEMLTAARMKIQKVQSKVRVNEEKLTE